MKCENCGINHSGKYASGRFCSVKCARGFSTKAKRKEINEKVRKTLSDRDLGHPKILVKICPTCKHSFEVIWKRRKKEYCSTTCVHNSIEVKKKISKVSSKRCSTIEGRKRMRDIGRKGGFGTKGKLSNGIRYESLLEKECFKWLVKNDIKFEPHKHIPNSSKVSDIYFPDLDLWIEIDGINREKRKKWLGDDYTYWINKLEIYETNGLKYEICYNLENLKNVLNHIIL